MMGKLQGGTDPYGTYAATSAYVVNKWVNTENPKYDYAVVKIGSDLTGMVGYFGYGYNDDNSFLKDRKITVRGYPGDKPNGTMWTDKGKIKKVNTSVE